MTTFGPFKKPDPQPWETKRAEVQAHAKAQEDERTLSLEHRVSRLETEGHETRSLVRAEMSSMREAFLNVNRVLDQLVTREHLQTVRMQVNGLLILAAFAGLYFIFGR